MLIYGLYLVKLAIAVVLAGGSPMEDSSTGIRIRSEPHIILVGDPGTGKSQLLRFASKIIPRSVLTTGVGSTAAGLTVTATMEHGEWQLEGGALVMADGGICCIDEFNSMKEHDRTCIHEAMEQQTISVAKASMVCKLNTRCSILAACNPKGNLDPSQPLCMNIALPSPLLSRFDLILLLRDTVNQEWDERVADYILNGGDNFSKLTDSGLWTLDILQTYFVTIKKNQPKLSKDAETILGTYYQMQRRIDTRNKARTTVRLLESLVRLSQGHARLMYHESVEIIDSIYAIILVDTAMDWDSAILNLNVTLNSVFPEKPVRDYRQMLEVIMNKLQLPQILEKEINQLSKSRSNSVQSRFFNCRDLVIGNTMNDNARIERDTHSVEEKQCDSVQQNENEFLNPGNSVSNNTSSSDRINNVEMKSGPDKKSSFFDSEWDEGYDTISFDIPDTKNKSGKTVDSQAKTINTKTTLKATDKMKSIPKRTLVKISKSSLFDSDTVLFDDSTSKKGVDGDIKSKFPSQKASHENIRQKIDSNENDNGFNSFGNPDSSKPGPSRCKENKDSPQNILPKTNGNLRVESNENPPISNIGVSDNVQKSSSAQSIRDKLKKFKFSRIKKDPITDHEQFDENTISKQVSSHGKENSQKNIINDEMAKRNVDSMKMLVENSSAEVNLENETGKRMNLKWNSSEHEKKKKILKRKGGSDDSIGSYQNDLEMLKHMPGVNDRFNIDLDFDWDSLDIQDQNDAQNKADSMLDPKSGVAHSTQILKNISVSRFSPKSSILKKSSKGTSYFDSLMGSNRLAASQSSNIFECPEDDLNFDI
ncbi:hypothetical protein JTB14_013262 [Gonioctena quinquepunctata]|nr:hypothetical protein JTB14_013262 [Gonioctena quinquepunctata]